MSAVHTHTCFNGRPMQRLLELAGCPLKGVEATFSQPVASVASLA